MTMSEQKQLRQRVDMNDTNVDRISTDFSSYNINDFGNRNNSAIQVSEQELSPIRATHFEGDGGIDYGAVNELIGDINELRRGLILLLFLFATLAVFIALDDHNIYDKIANSNRHEQDILGVEYQEKSPYPHRGHKIQLNSSAFTVNDYECLQLDTGNWPSERVHCELLASSGDTNGDDVARYNFVVEHFDDKNCQDQNADNPIVRHTASGCYYFEAYNHSYNDICHTNRTLTVSAFYGPGCMSPMPVTAVNVLPEDQ